MTREEHIYQLKQYLQGKSISMCPASSLYWQEHWEEVIKALEQEHILDKVKADITKFADTIQFNIGEVKAKYTNIGQHDGLEQALEIIDGNIKGDFDIDKWMAESEE